MEIVRHKWRPILESYGIDAKFLVNKHGPCPVCSGKDRFRFDDKNGEGTWICSNCGAGDGFDLIMKKTKAPFNEIASKIRTISKDLTPSPTVSYKIDPKMATERQRTVWSSSWKPEKYGFVDLYLLERLGRHYESNAIRENILYNTELKSECPVMVTKIAGPNDKAANIHLTWLSKNGEKADVQVQKQVMAGSLPDGSAIRIQPSAKRMGIAEGIETAISASIIFQMPVWSAINANGVRKWVPPEIAKEVWVFSDNDHNFVGQKASYTLAERLAFTNKYEKIVVSIPDWPHKDWNDLLKGSKL